MCDLNYEKHLHSHCQRYKTEAMIISTMVSLIYSEIISITAYLLRICECRKVVKKTFNLIIIKMQVFQKGIPPVFQQLDHME